MPDKTQLPALFSAADSYFSPLEEDIPSSCDLPPEAILGPAPRSKADSPKTESSIRTFQSIHGTASFSSLCFESDGDPPTCVSSDKTEIRLFPDSRRALIEHDQVMLPRPDQNGVIRLLSFGSGTDLEFPKGGASWTQFFKDTTADWAYSLTDLIIRGDYLYIRAEAFHMSGTKEIRIGNAQEYLPFLYKNDSKLRSTLSLTELSKGFHSFFSGSSQGTASGNPSSTYFLDPNDRRVKIKLVLDGVDARVPLKGASIDGVNVDAVRVKGTVSARLNVNLATNTVNDAGITLDALGADISPINNPNAKHSIQFGPLTELSLKGAQLTGAVWQTNSGTHILASSPNRLSNFSYDKTRLYRGWDSGDAVLNYQCKPDPKAAQKRDEVQDRARCLSLSGSILVDGEQAAAGSLSMGPVSAIENGIIAFDYPNYVSMPNELSPAQLQRLSVKATLEVSFDTLMDKGLIPKDPRLTGKILVIPAWYLDHLFVDLEAAARETKMANQVRDARRAKAVQAPALSSLRPTPLSIESIPDILNDKLILSKEVTDILALRKTGPKQLRPGQVWERRGIYPFPGPIQWVLDAIFHDHGQIVSGKIAFNGLVNQGKVAASEVPNTHSYYGLKFRQQELKTASQLRDGDQTKIDTLFKQVTNSMPLAKQDAIYAQIDGILQANEKIWAGQADTGAALRDAKNRVRLRLIDEGYRVWRAYAEAHLKNLRKIYADTTKPVDQIERVATVAKQQYLAREDRIRRDYGLEGLRFDAPSDASWYDDEATKKFLAVYPGKEGKPVRLEVTADILKNPPGVSGAPKLNFGGVYEDGAYSKIYAYIQKEKQPKPSQSGAATSSINPPVPPLKKGKKSASGFASMEQNIASLEQETAQLKTQITDVTKQIADARKVIAQEKAVARAAPYKDNALLPTFILMDGFSINEDGAMIARVKDGASDKVKSTSPAGSISATLDGFQSLTSIVSGKVASLVGEKNLEFTDDMLNNFGVTGAMQSLGLEEGKFPKDLKGALKVMVSALMTSNVMQDFFSDLVIKINDLTLNNDFHLGEIAPHLKAAIRFNQPAVINATARLDGKKAEASALVPDAILQFGDVKIALKQANVHFTHTEKGQVLRIASGEAHLQNGSHHLTLKDSNFELVISPTGELTLQDVRFDHAAYVLQEGNQPFSFDMPKQVYTDLEISFDPNGRNGFKLSGNDLDAILEDLPIELMTEQNNHKLAFAQTFDHLRVNGEALAVVFDDDGLQVGQQESGPTEDLFSPIAVTAVGKLQYRLTEAAKESSPEIGSANVGYEINARVQSLVFPTSVLGKGEKVNISQTTVDIGESRVEINGNTVGLAYLQIPLDIKPWGGLFPTFEFKYDQKAALHFKHARLSPYQAEAGETAHSDWVQVVIDEPSFEIGGKKTSNDVGFDQVTLILNATGEIVGFKYKGLKEAKITAYQNDRLYWISAELKDKATYRSMYAR